MVDLLGLSKLIGVVVNLVEKGGLVEKVGVEVGDVILKFDGKVVNNLVDLLCMVVIICLGICFII